jgi:hypothetical protein
MKNIPVGDELPEAANQKAIERKLREILGPPPQEATSADIEEPTKPPEPAIVVSDSIPATAPEIEGATAVVEPGQEPITDEKTKEETEADDAAEDLVVDTAVDDIVAKESDTVLEAEDADVAKAFEPPKTGLKTKVGQFFKRWWTNKWARWITITLLVLALLGAAVWPTSRYLALNSFGVRGSAALTVTDDSSQQPLKNIQISLGGQTALTGSDGIAHLYNVRLGKTQLMIQKRAYAAQTKLVTIGWGSNPLGSFSLIVTGSQYHILALDFLSGKPIAKVEASTADAEAISDSTGEIVLAIDPSEAAKLDVSIKADGYRSEKLSFSADTKTTAVVHLVPARKEVFVSKRSGTYDVYKTDADGKNEQVVLKGSGFEQDNMVLLPHPTDETVALVSTRDKVYNSDGYQLSTLTLINLDDDTTKSLVQSERIRLVGWTANRLVYVQIAAGASAANSKRYRVISYDYKTGDKREIASGNYFNNVTLVGDSIYYAPANLYQNDPSNGFFKATADGTIKQSVLSQSVDSSLRVSYEALDLAVGETWYEYKLGTTVPTKLATAPPNYQTRVYIDSSDRSRSLWVDSRDGKGVLVLYDPVTKVDKVLVTQSGLVNPVRWLSKNTIIYRIHTDQETADYVLNVDGGAAQKIKDVTNTTGQDQWDY